MASLVLPGGPEKMSAQPGPLSPPQEMQADSRSLQLLLDLTEQKTKTMGLKGWPLVANPNDWSLEPGPVSRLAGLTRRVWANDRILWIRINNSNRWDALALAELKTSVGEARRKLIWIRDAFGKCEIESPLPHDAWSDQDVLFWEDETPGLYAPKFLNASSPAEIQLLWSSFINGKPRSFSAMPPDSDAGLTLRFDPDLGVAYEALIGSVNDEDGETAITLEPGVVKKSKVLRKTTTDVWLLASVWPAPAKPSLCVVSKADWTKVVGGTP